MHPRLGVFLSLLVGSACTRTLEPPSSTRRDATIRPTEAPALLHAPMAIEAPSVGVPQGVPSVAAVRDAPPVDAVLAESRCALQSPQTALKRASYVLEPGMSPEERAARRRLHHDAIAFRTRHYGYVEGFGDPRWNPLEPKHYAKDGRFFGIPVRMNVRVLDALGCVEKALVERCRDTPYQPHVLDGLRTANTFHNDEASNHLYGIAIDVDFDSNPCCGCVARISDRPLCKKPVSSPFERTTLPRCWVDTFEAFGFAWLGYDRLEDTMHFEFLGDPDRILKRETSSG